MKIDWSKAPEGATHAAFTGGPDGHHVWYIIRDSEYSFVYSDRIEKGFQLGVGGPGHRPLIERPAMWNGAGLPPVGAEIEALLPGLGNSRFWQQAKVVHGPLPDSPGEILVFSLESTRPSWVDEFRPLRTPEQIAAEEREKAIGEIAEILGGLVIRKGGCRIYLRSRLPQAGDAMNIDDFKCKGCNRWFNIFQKGSVKWFCLTCRPRKE